MFSKASSRTSVYSFASSLPSRASNFTAEAMARLDRLESVSALVARTPAARIVMRLMYDGVVVE